MSPPGRDGAFVLIRTAAGALQPGDIVLPTEQRVMHVAQARPGRVSLALERPNGTTRSAEWNRRTRLLVARPRSVMNVTHSPTTT